MTEEKPDGAIAGEAIREAVREQIASGEPPEAKRTYERLLGRGLSEEQAVEFISAVLASEMFEMLRNETPHDRDRYEAALRALPKLPWESEG